MKLSFFVLLAALSCNVLANPTAVIRGEEAQKLEKVLADIGADEVVIRSNIGRIIKDVTCISIGLGTSSFACDALTLNTTRRFVKKNVRGVEAVKLMTTLISSGFGSPLDSSASAASIECYRTVNGNDALACRIYADN